MNAWVQKQRGRPEELLTQYGLDAVAIMRAASE